jgi:soluble lytic murein transglycosylase-like protein
VASLANLSLYIKASIAQPELRLRVLQTNALDLYLISRKIRLLVWRFQVLFCSAIIAALTMTSRANAADVFASVDAQGQPKWSTQALDSSYQKVIYLPSDPQIAVVKNTPTTQSTGRLEERRRQIYPLVDSVSAKYGIETSYVMALIEIESGFNPQAISPKGARGLMQLMPATASHYGMLDTKELFEPARNLDIGVRHLKDLLATHNGQWALAIASYNAGQHAVAKYGPRIPSYTETMLYVPAVLSAAARQGSAPSASSTPIPK